MNFYIESDLKYPQRQHPWDRSDFDENAAYYDFKSQPELIRSCIEDLRGHSDWEGVQRWYGMLEWLNGPDSIFETNDVYFRGPRKNVSPQVQKQLQAIGRVAVLYRNLEDNCNSKTVASLVSQIGKLLSVAEASGQNCVGLSLWETYFRNVERFGDVVLLRFWAWGDTELETMESLDNVIQNLDAMFKRIDPR